MENTEATKTKLIGFGFQVRNRELSIPTFMVWDSDPANEWKSYGRVPAEE